MKPPKQASSEMFSLFSCRDQDGSVTRLQQGISSGL